MKIRRVSLATLSSSERAGLLRRSAVPDPDVKLGAAGIVDDVRQRGDAALWDYTDRFGGGLPGRNLRVQSTDLEAALDAIDDELRRSLESAIDNIRTVHAAQHPADGVVEPVEGVRVERRWTPLRRVGVYVPGGRATYPSSLLMGVVPASQGRVGPNDRLA